MNKLVEELKYHLANAEKAIGTTNPVAFTSVYHAKRVLGELLEEVADSQPSAIQNVRQCPSCWNSIMIWTESTGNRVVCSECGHRVERLGGK